MNVKDSGYIEAGDIEYYNVLEDLRIIDKAYARLASYPHGEKASKK